MFLRRFLKRLRDYDNSDVEKNPNSGFERNQTLDRLNRPGETKKSDEQPIQCRIAGTRPESLPTWMTNINSRWKNAAEERCRDGANPIGHERWKGAVTVTRCFRAFDVLQRSHDVENSHGKNDRKIIQKARI